MSNKISNPPAFPGIRGPKDEVQEGMTLRDYFAAKAMQGLLHPNWKTLNDQIDNEKQIKSNPTREDVARWAYEYADAMLAEREEEKGSRELTEICLCAAIQTKEGKIIRGHRHNDCLWAIHNAKLTAGKQGFLTSYGRFVSRLEGRRLQNAAGIPSACPDGYTSNTLFSEDLY